MRPPIPITEVMETGRRFERYGRIVHASGPSLLTADVGGALFFTSLRIYDLGMLTDRTIAQTLGSGVHSPSRKLFHDYIFEQVRPTFILTRAYHSWLARLDSDPRFRRDYEVIKEYEDKWVQQRYGVRVTSGDYVRRDVLHRDLAALRALQLETNGVHYVGCIECAGVRQ